MEENNEEQKILSGVVMDGVVDGLLTDKGKLTKELEDEKEKNKKLIKEIMEMKKPKSTRFWVKVYKDTDVSFLSFRDRGILFSLCQLVGNNKEGYLEDKKTGGLIETWALLGENIGIKDNSHTAEKCKALVDKGILIVESIGGHDLKYDGMHNAFKEMYEKNHAKSLHPDNFIKKRHFRLNQDYISIGRNK